MPQEKHSGSPGICFVDLAGLEPAEIFHHLAGRHFKPRNKSQDFLVRQKIKPEQVHSREKVKSFVGTNHTVFQTATPKSCGQLSRAVTVAAVVRGFGCTDEFWPESPRATK